MARLNDIPEPERSELLALPCPTFNTQPWITGPPLRERRVAIISTAGLHTRHDRTFSADASDYRVIPGDVGTDDLVMSHISSSFDRTGFQQDLNVVLPLDRLRELAAERVIGSVADFHYSFMGATAPEEMEPAVRYLAPLLRQDRTDAVLLAPV